MILDEIVLHDFGVYGGRQTIALTPIGPAKPIILFGGLNGGGKTTLLDALQLAFFGNVAKCAARADLSYEEYLRRSVHQGALEREAAVEVAFRHTIDGEVQNWRLVRSWSARDSVRERFHVYRNGQLDKAAAEQWSAQVEDFIPARIAPLFLFDGEKVEGYADLNEAPALIRTAIQNLLGLDIVERLGGDLQALERRRKSDLATPADAELLTGLRDQMQQLACERARHIRERASTANEIDRLTRFTRELEERFEREGGALFDDRGRLEAELVAGERDHEAVRRSMREMAAGALPMVLVSPLLRKIAEQADGEEKAKRSAQAVDAISREFAALLALPILRDLPRDAQGQIHNHIEKRRKRLARGSLFEQYLDLDDASRNILTNLLNVGLSEAREQAGELLRLEKELRHSVAHTRDLLSAVPNQAAIADLISQRESARNALNLAEFEQNRRSADIAKLEREIEVTKEREIRLLEATARQQFESEDITRLLTHSTKVRATLDLFQKKVIEHHVSRIESFVLDSFRQLVRKRSLVTSLRIDPVTFALDLKGDRGQQLTAERLSAGERQLLAIAILWGLARASGRPLPMVIDTPLGRLDAEHRTRLVEHYFPYASHQVILLSTDQEITQAHYSALRSSVGRSYRLTYDQGAHRTIVEPGYFDEAA